MLRHVVTGKRYVGRAKYFRSRMASHTSKLRRDLHHCSYLQNAVNKYGLGAFEFVIVEVLPSTEHEEREGYYLRLWKGKDTLYNASDKTGGGPSFLTEETKARMSKSALEMAPEVRARVVFSVKNMSAESRARVTGSHLNVPHTEETKVKMSKAHMGKKASAISIAKRVKKVLGTKRTLEQNANNARAQTGKTLSEETKVSISVSCKEWWTDERREAKSKDMTGISKHPDAVAKTAKSHTGMKRGVKAIANMRKAQAGRIPSPAATAAAAIVNTGSKHSPDSIIKMQKAWTPERKAAQAEVANRRWAKVRAEREALANKALDYLQQSASLALPPSADRIHSSGQSEASATDRLQAQNKTTQTVHKDIEKEMSIFDRIESATFSEGGNYLKQGNFDLEITKIKLGKTRKLEDYFAVDFKIIGTSSTEMQIGEAVNWFQGFKHDSALGNIKQFVTALLASAGPVAPDAITAAFMDALVDKDGAAVAGSRIRVQVTPVPTKTGGTFSRHLWLPAGATETAAQAAA